MSQISVGFQGEGAGVAELTWGQTGIWRTMQQTGRTMNLVVKMPLPEGTPLAEMVAVLRFMAGRHPAMRTRLRFVDPSDRVLPRQVVAGSGELPLEIADIDDDDDVAAVAEDMRARYEFTPFDYEREFPLRMCVIRRAGELVHLVVGYCHVVIDGIGIGVLGRDLANLDRATGEATAPPVGPNPLDIARGQHGPAGLRQTRRSMRYWAAQLDRMAEWRQPDPPAQRHEPRFRELVGYSPAMELGMRAIAARAKAGTTYVLLAAYSVAVTRMFGRDPAVAQIVVNNRFRPGFATAVSQISQPGICVVDTGNATFDEVVARAQAAGTSASFYGYYDTEEHRALLAEAAARRGGLLDIGWFLNDRRAMFRTEDGSVPTAAEVERALPRTRLFWGRGLPTFDSQLFMQVDSEPQVVERRSLSEGLPAVYLEVWTDTHRFGLDLVEAFVREMESVVVEAALGTREAAIRG